MSDTETVDNISEKGTAESQNEPASLPAETDASQVPERQQESADQIEKTNPSNDSLPASEAQPDPPAADATAAADHAETVSAEQVAPQPSLDCPPDQKPKEESQCADPIITSPSNGASSTPEPTAQVKNASADPSPEARALRGEEDSDASEQFFTVRFSQFSFPVEDFPTLHLLAVRSSVLFFLL